MRKADWLPGATLLLAATAVLSCGGDDPQAPPEPQVLNIAGNWSFSSNISSSSAGISCTSSGTATISQSGVNFTGSATATSGVCTDSFGNTVDNTGTSAISGGQVNGNQVSFQVPDCQLTGSISGSPPNAMSGTETCTIAVSGTNHTFTGPWQASR